MRKNRSKIPKLKCKECGKLFLIVQPTLEIELGIEPRQPENCNSHE